MSQSKPAPNPQVALITGAAQGLGQAIAESLFEAGFIVVVSDINEKGAAALADSLDSSNKRALGLPLDVCERADFAEALDKIVEIYGACHVLVNNAAMTPTTPVMDISVEEFDKVLQVNLRGTFLGCQLFGAYFAEQKYGRIINMGSLAAQTGGTASGAHYAASKGGILTLTKFFARLFADSQVTVNAIAPGPVDVPSIREKVPAEKLAEIIETVIPIKQMSDPAFIAHMVAMLASEQAGAVTGACWDANGGIFMR